MAQLRVGITRFLRILLVFAAITAPSKVAGQSSISPGDFDGDKKSDVTVYRPSTGVWWVLKSSTDAADYDTYQWGVSTDIPEPGDYDGDGKTDIAVYRPAGGHHFVKLSSTNFTDYRVYQWGTSTDIPAPGDYDGDGKTDIAVYRPESGHHFILLSSTNFTTYRAPAWGGPSDVPVPGDYDGDGKTDIAVYRAITGSDQRAIVHRILFSSTNFTTSLTLVWGYNSTDIPEPGDYDGDGKTDIAFYNPDSGSHVILLSSTNFTFRGPFDPYGWRTYRWGTRTDIPVPGDYDGDGTTDIAVYRPESGHHFVLLSSTDFTDYRVYQWGVSTDVPILNPVLVPLPPVLDWH
jgi:hypothetical protein